MKEEIIKRITIEYLTLREKKEIRVKKKGEHGPDIVVEGKAFECKGSNLNEKGEQERLFRQLIRWSPEYATLNLVLPCDVLDLVFLCQLGALEKFIRQDSNIERSIGILTVAKVSEEKQEYAIYNWHSARWINFHASTIIYELSPNFIKITPLDRKSQEIIQFLKEINTRMKNEFEKLTILKARECEKDGRIYEGKIIQLK